MRSCTRSMSKKECTDGIGGASTGDECPDAGERSDLGSRRLAFEAARLRVRAAERRERCVVERRLRVDLTERTDRASDLSTFAGELKKVALDATAVAVTPTTTAMSVLMVMSPRVPVSSISCVACKRSGHVPMSGSVETPGVSVLYSGCSLASEISSLSATSSSSSSNSMAILSASRHASSSSSSRVWTLSFARFSS